MSLRISVLDRPAGGRVPRHVEPPLAIADEIMQAEKACKIAERELVAAQVFVDGLRRESCPTSDAAWIGGQLRIRIAAAVCREAATWLRLAQHRQRGRR